MDIKKARKGQMASSTASMIVGLLMVAIVIGVMITQLNSSITLTGTGNTTYYLIQTMGWTALTIVSVGIIAYAGRWIMGIFS